MDDNDKSQKNNQGNAPEISVITEIAAAESMPELNYSAPKAN